ATFFTLACAVMPGMPATGFASRAGAGAATTWLGVVVLGLVLVAKTPYFHGLFRERLPEDPTFGGRGILWASLTLALMTLPVVIVATEEAISAVPGSMREGSLACGATRWQTIRRIVLPAAQPGIMTGAILAMARGAGEVAPLMLVGAVNLAPALPVSADAPFLHADRTFMHLGFHIYNLGFQNPDSEATEPLVWTTTLLLITIVLALNFAAIIIRGRLRARSHGASV
ncbi:MAG: PstA family ABC transporter permease, partial [Phycisphaerales bacterium JB059]